LRCRPEGKTVFVNLEEIRLEPNDDAPGTESDRAAIEIGDGGGTVILYTKENGSQGYNYVGGRITARSGGGTCRIYVYAHNGVYKKVTVTVK